MFQLKERSSFRSHLFQRFDAATLDGGLPYVLALSLILDESSCFLVLKKNGRKATVDTNADGAACWLDREQTVEYRALCLETVIFKISSVAYKVLHRSLDMMRVILAV